MSDRSEHLAPTILVVFGTTGDLMARKIVPSLFYLRGQGAAAREAVRRRLRPARLGRRASCARTCAAILAERATDADPADVEEFLQLFRYQRGEFHDPAVVRRRRSVHLDAIQDEWGVCSNKLFYLAVPPEHYETIFRQPRRRAA